MKIEVHHPVHYLKKGSRTGELSRSLPRIPRRSAFTLVELLTVVAIVAILAGLLFPALVQAKIKAQAAGCLNNLKQLQVAWQMYANDFNDILLPNAPSPAEKIQAAPNYSGNFSWCGIATEGWDAQDANTNTAYYARSILWPYLGGQVRVYKCPGDIVPSANGQRLRSYSMNGQVGQYLLAQLGPAYVANFNPGYKVYNTMNDLGCPGPAMSWIFSEEYPGSINDGFLVVDMTAGSWPDVPGSSHSGACGISFADSHVELKKWASPQLDIAAVRGIPVHNIQGGAGNADYLWFTLRSACLVGH